MGSCFCAPKIGLFGIATIDPYKGSKDTNSHSTNQASQPLHPAAPPTLSFLTNSTDLISPGSDTTTYSEYPPGTHPRYLSNLAKVGNSVGSGA